MSQSFSQNQAKRNRQQRLWQQKWSLKTKAIVWALSISVLPVVAIGTATYNYGTNLINTEIPQVRLESTKSLTESELALQRELSLLLAGMGVTAILAGAIAVFVANRVINRVRKAAATSNIIKNKLRPDSEFTQSFIASQDELVMLESNINLFTEMISGLLQQKEAEADYSQLSIKITRWVRESFNEEDVLKTTSEEIRKALSIDRVTIFCFNSNCNGTFITESVAPGLPKMLGVTVSNTGFEAGYIEKYQNGCIRAIDDIYQANLSDGDIELLEQFAVKSNLVAPILKGKQLFGLLIAHQCSRVRFWQQSEINLFAHIAIQVGFALDYARLLKQVDSKADRAQVFIETTRSIRQSLNEEDVLKTTVEEVRKVLSTDRVLVYSFNANWVGTVIAESVVPGYPKVLRTEIQDICFTQGYIEKYQSGRVQATNNIYEAGLTDCHINLLESFAVKANLVAPILKDEHLFGLLIAHQCSRPRDWQKPEIDLFAQIAMQVGFALDHARLLQRIDAEGVQSRLLADTIGSIRQSLNEEDVLKTTVEEVRKVLGTDRVLVYSFNADWSGIVIAESVVLTYPKVLQAEIRDPCFGQGYVEQYQSGRVLAINNIYEIGLADCHISLLESFAVKANLVAPIIKDKQLFGLLIAHQCSKPRDWQQSEIDLFAQIAMQVGFALDHARLLQRIEAERMRSQLLVDIIRKIRQSLNEEDVIKTTVEEVRKALSTDRVLVYSFYANWFGIIIAESVVPGYPKVLRSKIHDPCFTQGYVEKYQSGRVMAINNIYESSLADCHIKLLESFGVKANLVAPIIKDEQLFGLLIAHQCSEPRDWQQSEIDLFTQIAMQVGFTLDHARLLQAYQTAEANSDE
ncbi:GAF domain-containing protein [Nostoc sp. 'Lobaria pulmonaria (5183) cyanobiont']|uniref:GAF domain-containing protein n=1 Tax=Nostoc sp. 'Lobaria pulmonaria (5183) cyanobiont' TaxID=1618022 RepID=UPI000CF34FF8|nr:GAF domain-containing protein [Nostoc sp. 'Lobaria pulmonaria (5183) cyanobiont']AVH74091.1 GAF domain-containing protein [Nostoc sp. 'Lobaria pulmonaria (5183) cyanobiont']